MATLMTDADLRPLFDDLFDFIQGTFDVARKARLLVGEPPANADAFTLDQADPVAEEANIALVEEQLRLIKDLIVKVDDGASELQYAINFLKDNARRKPALPTSIGGPPFGTITQKA